MTIFENEEPEFFLQYMQWHITNCFVSIISAFLNSFSHSALTRYALGSGSSGSSAGKRIRSLILQQTHPPVYKAKGTLDFARIVWGTEGLISSSLIISKG